MELSNVANLVHSNISSGSGVIAFVVISGIYLTGQFLLLRFSKVMTSDLRSRRNDVRFVDSIVSIVQLFIFIIFFLIIAEITLGRSYDLFVLIVVTIVSNGLTAVIMFFLFKRLLGYYKSASSTCGAIICHLWPYNLNNCLSNNFFYGSYSANKTSVHFFHD